MSLTSLASFIFKPRQKELEKYNTAAEELQQKVLSSLIESGGETEYGRNHLLKNTHNYEQFAQNIPVNT